MRELEIEGTKVAVAQEALEFLGRIVWYSVSEQTIPYEDLEDLLTKEGVPREAWPRHTRPIDAFKNAVRSAESRDHTTEYETTVDASGARKTDSKTMLVVSRVHDQVADALPVTMKVGFDAKSETLTFSSGRAPALGSYAGAASSYSVALEDRILKAYDVYLSSYQADDIRRMIVNAIRAAYAVVLKRSGGVYFIPEPHAKEVEAVARIVDQIPGADMVALPVIDREPERKTVLKRYEKATLERIEELMLQVRDVVAKGEKVVPSAYMRYLNEVEYLREQKAKYTDLLEDAMSKVDVEMQVLGSEIGKMAQLVEE